MHSSITRFGLLLALPALLFLSACDRHDHGEDHQDMARAELVTRGAVPEVVATWTRATGWQPQALPALTVGNASNNYGRASLTVRVFNDENQQIIEPGPRDAAGNRVCGEFSARYRVTSGNAAVYDPVNAMTVMIDGQARDIYHCDHVYIYPRQAGTANLEILLWHVDHADEATTALQVPVLAAPPTAAPTVAAN